MAQHVTFEHKSQLLLLCSGRGTNTKGQTRATSCSAARRLL
jgi:hypothetical protein